MIKLFLRSLALSLVLTLGTMMFATRASAHDIKHSHHAPQPTVLQLLLKSLATPQHHGHTHKYIVTVPAPQPQGYTKSHSTITKVHKDMCVTGTSWLNARSGPSTKHRVLAELGEGQRIHVTTCKTTNYGKSTWCQFDLGYGKTAWVSKKFIDVCPVKYKKW